MGMLLLFGGNKWEYIASLEHALGGKKHTYNVKELLGHYITEEACTCLLGQRKNQYSSGPSKRHDTQFYCSGQIQL